MTSPQFVDISSWQPASIDWPAYVAWAKSFDGTSRVSLRAVEFLGKEDTHYQAYRDGFLAAGGDIVIHYGFVYPDRNNATAEATYLAKVVGDLSKRPNDVLMLDLERNATTGGDVEWAFEWGTTAHASYAHNEITLYASDSYIRANLPDTRLPGLFSLSLAFWQFNPNEQPPCPPPWKEYRYLQWTDKETVPGIAGTVDGDKFMGVEGPVVVPPPVVPPRTVRIGGGEDFKLILIGDRWTVVAKHSSEAGLKKDGYIS